MAKLASSEMKPPSQVLRLKSDHELPKEVHISKVDTSNYKVIEEPPKPKKSAPSNAYLSSFGSVLDSLKSGNNHSYDEVETSKPTIVVSSSAPIAMTVEMDPLRGRSQRRRKEVSAEVPVAPVVPVEKTRDMKEYHVPADMSVAINKEALDEVVQEMGSDQPTFLKRMIEDLKGK